jgi:protein-S-isoprenylcysteine O-methyltransferase Ste14
MLDNHRFSLRAVQFDLDLIERVVVAVLLGFLAARMIPDIMRNATYMNFLLLMSEALIVAFVIFRRRTTAISHRTFDWVLGFAGTFAPLMAIPAQGKPLIPTAYCALLLLSGLCLQLAAKLTLRRSFGLVAANRGVKIGGPYSFVRHPMYAGYILTHVGFLLSGPSLWNLVIYGLTSSLLVARILAEERLLNQDSAYRSFAANVRYRLIPFIF